jgi:hypothetical protein
MKAYKKFCLLLRIITLHKIITKILQIKKVKIKHFSIRKIQWHFIATLSFKICKIKYKSSNNEFLRYFRTIKIQISSLTWRPGNNFIQDFLKINLNRNWKAIRRLIRQHLLIIKLTQFKMQLFKELIMFPKIKKLKN